VWHRVKTVKSATNGQAQGCKKSDWARFTKYVRQSYDYLTTMPVTSWHRLTTDVQFTKHLTIIVRQTYDKNSYRYQTPIAVKLTPSTCKKVNSSGYKRKREQPLTFHLFLGVRAKQSEVRVLPVILLRLHQSCIISYHIMRFIARPLLREPRP